MKTICFNENNISIYLFDDTTFVDIQEDKIVIGNPVEYYISDCNKNNTTLFENVTSPDDWIGWKYFYTLKDEWVLNPEWNSLEP